MDLDISLELEDIDGNGLPDPWERLHFGRIGVDPLADPDGDGMSNLAEYKAGTNPLDFQSQFAFIRVRSQAGGIRVEWSSVTNRTYVVQRSGQVLAGYQDVATGLAATPTTNSYLDTTTTGPGPFFYRLRLQ